MAETVDGPYLCEAFGVTRWVPGYPLHQELTLKRVAVVAPKLSDLKYVPEERN